MLFRSSLATGEGVICFLGDGAFFFGVHGLWPARALNLPITFVVLDNRGFGSTRWFEEKHVEQYAPGSAAGYMGSNFADTTPSVAEVARGFGLPTTVLSGPDDLAPGLNSAVQQGTGPSVLVVPLPS